MTNFQTRALSATVFAAVMLGGLFTSQGAFVTLFTAIMMGCLWEFLNLTLPQEPFKQTRKWLSFGLISALFMGLIATRYETHLAYSPLVFALGFGAMSLFFGGLILELFLKSDQPFQNLSTYAVSVFYPVIPFYLVMMVSKVGGNFTPQIVAGILFLNWMNDSGAYIVGSQLGKTPFFPRISPKKTWEGTIGGGLFSLGLGYVLSLFFTDLTLTDWLVVAGIVAVFGSIGDLIESMLKRSVGVKDSGNLMPGHGGFLDRFDAFLFCMPFVYFYLSLCARQIA